MAKFLNIDTSNYDFLVDFILEGTSYKLHCYYTTRGNWYLSFYNPSLFISVDESDDESKGLLLGGIRVMPDVGQNFLDVSTGLGLPKGILTTSDTNPNAENEGDEPRITADNFGKGKRFRLIYLTEKEKVDLFGD